MSIVKVGCGEYRTVYLHDDGTVWATLWNNNYQYMKYDVANAVGVVGGQYTGLCWTKEGVAYELETNSQGGPSVQRIDVPGGVVYGQMLNQAKFLVNGLGDLYYMCEGSDTKTWDQMRFGASAIPKLILSGQKIIKIAASEDQDGILLLTNYGNVLHWKPGAITPITMAISEVAIDIAMTRGAYVVVTKSDIIAWGRLMSYVTGLKGVVSSFPVSVLKYWPIKFPIKQIAGSWNTLHIIDDNNDMYGSGENIMGEVGIGKGCPDWKNYKGPLTKALQPFQWDWSPEQMLQAPTKLDGKWSAVHSGGSMAFNHHANNLKGELSAWGRNKKKELGNGRILKENGLDATYPNWEDVWYPTRVDPDKITAWTVVDKFDLATAPNNASFTLIPPDPIPELPKQIVALQAGGWAWYLFDDGSVRSSKI